jgi:hypothetical protein
MPPHPEILGLCFHGPDLRLDMPQPFSVVLVFEHLPFSLKTKRQKKKPGAKQNKVLLPAL